MSADKPYDPPSLDPLPTSTHWITTPSAVLQDAEASQLAVRLGLSSNAIVAQHRFVVSTLEEDGVAAARDRVAAFTVAAALTEETRVMINSQYKAVMALAKAGDAPDELVKEFGLLNSGTTPVSKVLGFVRNQLTFHWDPVPIASTSESCLTAPAVSVRWANSLGRRRRRSPSSRSFASPHTATGKPLRPRN